MVKEIFISEEEGSKLVSLMWNWVEMPEWDYGFFQTTISAIDINGEKVTREVISQKIRKQDKDSALPQLPKQLSFADDSIETV